MLARHSHIQTAGLRKATIVLDKVYTAGNSLPTERRAITCGDVQLYPAIISTRVELCKNIHLLCTGCFSTLGILAEYGGDILSQQAEVPFFYPCGVGPLVQHGTSIL